MDPAKIRAWHDSWHRNLGLFLVAIAQIFGVLMTVTTRLLEFEGEGMHPFQTPFVRVSITLFFCCLYMWYKSVSGFPFGAGPVRLLLVSRGVTGFFGIFGTYYSLQYLPMADAIVITFLAPSVASYGCYVFLKEPFLPSAQYASLVCLLGVLLIAHSTSFSSLSTETSAGKMDYASLNATNTPGENFRVPTSTQRLSSVGVTLLGMFGSAGAYTSICWIGSRAHPLISFLLTTGLAVGGRKNDSRATGMLYTNMLFALGLDKLVFGISPGWWSTGGSELILGGAVYVAVKQQQVVVKYADEEMGGRAEEEMEMPDAVDGEPLESSQAEEKRERSGMS
ncbi:integral membrane protein DUF6 [Calycina marina]|uniref:Integral membrane protein DUF6 n=1 Tax=Calycina marina TaxID=1763456 RepID=A0A9P7Z624_9HELO|nr:integral membrane protein DUF6 [Calycina marina]